MIKTAAIVGRPNVGKSTLFNSLLDSRKALTSASPGMTRDRTYAVLYPGAGKKCLLVDTGGLLPGVKETMAKKINLQVEAALEQADIILFVTDAKDGLTPLDEEIAHKLRRTEKPVLLVVNKVDEPSHEMAIGEFYSLGFENVTPLSATHKRNISSCAEFVSKYVPSDDLEEERKTFKVLSIAGKPNAGKSTLVNKIAGEERVIVDNVPGTTRNPARCPAILGEEEWELVDLAGMWRKKRGKKAEDVISMMASRREIENCDVCILLLDLSREITFQDKRIASWIIESGSAVVVAGSKLDLSQRSPELFEAYRESFRNYMPYLYFAPFLLISAKTGEGLENLFKEVNTIYRNAHKRIPDEDMDIFLQKALKKRPPPEAANERPLVISLRQTGVNPPVFTLLIRHRRLDKIQQSWKNYIRNSIYREFDFYGVPVKIKMKKNKPRNRRK